MIPATKPPSTTTLYGPPRGSRNNLSSSQPTSTEEEKEKTEDGVVNRGWNFLSDVFTATSNLKSRARSRDSLPVHNNNNSLDIPTIKTR